jgi:hypothetical protein
LSNLFYAFDIYACTLQICSFYITGLQCTSDFKAKKEFNRFHIKKKKKWENLKKVLFTFHPKKVHFFRNKVNNGWNEGQFVQKIDQKS